jgi:hypothetical protein
MQWVIRRKLICRRGFFFSFPAYCRFFPAAFLFPCLLPPFFLPLFLISSLPPAASFLPPFYFPASCLLSFLPLSQTNNLSN